VFIRNKKLFWALALVFFCQGTGVAQFDATMSSTGAEAAESRKAASQGRGIDREPNLKIWNMEFSFSAGLRGEFNDNIGLASGAKESDLILSPEVGINMHWPISQINNLDLKLGITYSKYLSHSELDTTALLIQPDSLLNLDVYIGDVRLNLHDSISLQQDPTENSQLSNLSAFKRFSNTIGVMADWDLNLVLLSAGYDLEHFQGLDEAFKFLNRETHMLMGKAGVRLSSTLNTGLKTSYSFTEYEQRLQNNSESYQFGVFGGWTVSEHLSAHAEMSYQESTYEQGGLIQDNTNFGSMIYSLGVKHQLNRWWNHSLEYKRFTELGIGTNFTENELVNYQVTADVIHDVTTSLSFSYGTFTDSQSQFGETADRFTINPLVEYPLFQSARLRLGYQWTQKESNRRGNNYEQNRVYAEFHYDF
jgi:hypothetical protein